MVSLESLFALDSPVVGPSSGPSESVFGRIAELRAEARLLELGHAVSRPSVDEGYDLVVDCHWRIQVKATRRLVVESAGGESRLKRRWTWTFVRGGDRRLANRCDFFLLYACDADAWWVVPAEDAAGKRIHVHPTGERDRAYREAWGLLS